ncbi:reverse transcriptase [Caerostris extrusa]|uniref:Reverse transcriptase n=1 Tax=Caerostris extrusa TaxID=172846 RepID=A0AAV4PFL7_CAEEX|nr:reverse transcriptase [Caerostris extrusa]
MKDKRLLKRYLWMNCIKEVVEKLSYDPCQRIGKSRRKKAPLIIVPIITQIAVFKINVDACRTATLSEKNNRYILTAFCIPSTYLHAIPVTDINSVSVTNELLEIFTGIGFL